MRLRLSSLLPFVLAGCASSQPRIADDRLATLPMQQRTELQSAERRAEQASLDVSTAEAARDEANTFLTVATSQDEAAQSQLRAEPIDASANARAHATQSKRIYAQRLLRLRDSELREKRSEL